MNSPVLDQQTCGGKWVQVVEHNPETVCSPQSLLVCALRTLGVALHPAPEMAFYSFKDERGSWWRWLLSEKSKDGIETAQLVKWWNDPAWLAAHPTHEFAIVRAALHNMGVQAAEMRQSIVRLIVTKGNMEAHIPVNASPAHRQWLLDQLNGIIPVGTPFVEPAPDPAPPAA